MKEIAFDGYFAFLPFRSQMDDGPLPTPTSDAFQAASCDAIHALNSSSIITTMAAAKVWRMEAIRARLHNPRVDVSSKEVMQAVAARLHKHLVNWQ